MMFKVSQTTFADITADDRRVNKTVTHMSVDTPK